MPLNLPRAEAPRFYAFHPSTGRPVSLGTVSFFNAGTNELKTIYADRLGENEAENPVDLDAAGSCEVYLSGAYRILVKDQQGAEVFDADQVNSIAIEAPEGNPGSFLVVNNLSEGTPATMRGVLELVKQTGAEDATADRVVLTGGGGLLGSPAAVTAENALNAVAVVRWNRVATANVDTVDGPAGAGDGIVWTSPFFGSVNKVQTYHPVSGDNPMPWRRVGNISSQDDWLRDFDWGDRTADGTTERWRKHPDGTLITTLAPMTISFSTAALLVVEWTPEVPFVGTVHAQITYPIGGGSYTGTSAAALGVTRCSNSGTTLTFQVARVTGASDFASGNSVASVAIRAEGRWKA